MTDPRISVAAFDSLSTLAAGALLEPVCASVAWVVAMVVTRPHGTLELLRTRSDEALAAMEWPDVLQALQAAPVDRPDDPDAQAAIRSELAATVRLRLGEVLDDSEPQPWRSR